MNLTMGQEKKLSSLDNRARLLINSNKNNINSIMEKHTVLLVRNCLEGNACKHPTNMSNLIIRASLLEILIFY